MKHIAHLFCLLFFLTPTISYAAVSIFPTSIEFDANSKKRAVSVRVINTTREKKTYRTKVVNFLQMPDGSYKEVDKETLSPEQIEAAPFADSYLSYSPRQFSLEAGQVQTIKIGRKPAPNLKDGEYVSHFKVQEVATPMPATPEDPDSRLSVSIKALHAVTIPVTLVKGDLTSTTKLLSFTQKPDIEGNAAVGINMERDGNRSSKVNIIILDDKNEKIAEVKSVSIYLSTKTREVILRLPKKAEEIKGKNLKVILEDEYTKQKISEKTASF